MARSLTNTSVILQLTSTLENVMSNNTERVTTGQVSYSKKTTISGGVSALEADRAWEWQGTLLNGQNRTLNLLTFSGFDLGAGDGKDVLGQSLELAEIVAILVSNENDAEAIGLLEVYPDASNGWSPLGRHTAALNGALGGGGAILKMQVSEDGLPVTSSSKNITLAATGGDVDYRILILGRSDADESSSSISSSSLSSNSSQSSNSSSSSSLSSNSSSSVNSSSSSVSSVNSSSSSSSSQNSSSSSSSNSSSSSSSSSSNSSSSSS